MATHDIDHEDDGCELCDALDALSAAMRRYLAVIRCTCQLPMLGVMLLGEHNLDVAEVHELECPRNVIAMPSVN